MREPGGRSRRSCLADNDAASDTAHSAAAPLSSARAVQRPLLVHPLPSRRSDACPECRDTDRTKEEVIAYHVAGRAADADRAGELDVLGDRRTDLIARHVAFERSEVEALIQRRHERPLLANRAAAAQELLMEAEILLSAGVLHAHRHRNARRLNRLGPQDRQFL